MAQKKNISSGAEKAEKLAKKKSTDVAEEKELKNLASGKDGNPQSTVNSTKTTKNKGAHTVKSEKPAKKTKAKKADKKKGANKVLSQKKAERKAKRAQKKEARAKLLADRKQARLERKLAHKEKKQERLAALKEKREERKERKAELREKRRERRDLLKSESKEARRERIAKEKQARREAKKAKHEAYLADKKAKREHRLKVRAEKRAERNEKRHAPGFGGWLAAVISLGVTSLALGTIVTFGWLAMDDMQAGMADGYTQSLYELNAIVDNLDADLARAKASSSSSDRVRVFSDIAIESETAETVLERFPLDMQMTEQLASFVNKMSDSAKSMLYTVANGGELSPSQIKSLNYMYETNAKVKEQLNELITSVDANDMLCAMRGKTSCLGDGFTAIQNNTFDDPKGIQDGPFADSVKKSSAKGLEGQKEITPQAAERVARKYFASYNVSGARCTGEAVTEALTVYNVNLTTPDGEMTVQLSKLGGKVVSFDSYKDCSDRKFSVERCVTIAEDFLAEIGYGELKPVWSSENGTTCNLNFAPVQGGAVIYPDLIKVKVCEERGIVTGVEALSYVLNHGEREIATPSVSKAEAQANVNGNMEITSSRKAVIPFNGDEVLCYEFIGTLEGNDYYVYVDATTGEELEVLTVIGTAQGRALM